MVNGTPVMRSVLSSRTWGGGKVVGLLDPLLQRIGQEADLLGVRRIVRHVAKLPGIVGKIVEFEPRPRCLEQTPLCRPQPPGVGAGKKGQKEGLAARQWGYEGLRSGSRAGICRSEC